VSLVCGSCAEREKAGPDTAAGLGWREGGSRTGDTGREGVPMWGALAD
jgi:hypothetical protein